MARPTKHDATTREALLDAAEEILATRGPDAVSVRSVAEAINSSTRAVYSVLGSKQALLEALAARGYGYLADLVEAVPRTDDAAADLARAGTKGFRPFAIGRPHLFRITFEQAAGDVYGQRQAYPQLERAFLALHVLVERALSTLEATSVTSTEVAFMFHSFCHGLAANELSREPPPVGTNFWRRAGDMAMESVWQNALTSFVRGLAGVP